MLTPEQIDRAWNASFDDPDYRDIQKKFARLIESLVNQEKDAEIAEYKRILEGIPQDAIDGGWTAKDICAYAKSLEDRLEKAQAEIARMKWTLKQISELHPEQASVGTAKFIAHEALQSSQSQVSDALPITRGDISELIGIAQFLSEQKHWEAQAGSRVLAEITKRLNDALQSIPAQPAKEETK